MRPNSWLLSLLPALAAFAARLTASASTCERVARGGSEWRSKAEAAAARVSSLCDQTRSETQW